MWFSNINIDGKSLKVKPGNPLPDNWQSIQSVKYLQNQFGDKCVEYRKPDDFGKSEQLLLLEVKKLRDENKAINERLLALESKKPATVGGRKRGR